MHNKGNKQDGLELGGSRMIANVPLRPRPQEGCKGGVSNDGWKIDGWGPSQASFRSEGITTIARTRKFVKLERFWNC